MKERSLILVPRLSYEFQTNLTSREAGSSRAVEIGATITATTERSTPGPDLPDLVLGRVKFILFRVTKAIRDGQSVLAVFDGAIHTHQIGASFFDFAADEYLPTIRRQFACGGEFGVPADMLLLDRLTIDPAARGQQLGLAVLHRVITDWSSGCDLVVMKPFPLQFENATKKRADKMTGLGLRGFSAAKPLALARLRAYYEKLGFERVGRTEYHALVPDLYNDGPAGNLRLPETIRVRAEAAGAMLMIPTAELLDTHG